jgi:hypothetical protein
MLKIIIILSYITILLLVISFYFNQVRDIIELNRLGKEFKRICDDCERWRDELDPQLKIDMMYEHLNFLSGYNHYNKTVDQLKYINDYRQNLINKYKHIIPSMVSEHRSRRLKEVLK